MNIQTFEEKLINGFKEFDEIDVEEGILENMCFQGVTFTSCYFSLTFRNINFQDSSFISCNLKTCSFINCNFIDSQFTDNLLCSARFINSTHTNMIFENNFYHSYLLTIDDLKSLI